jgi:salicylate hydroxylase
LEGDREAGRLSESSHLEVGIVGAGIAGTVLAIALKQGGLAVRLYDVPNAAPRPEAPLLLTSNGTRVLHAIGLKDSLAAIALLPQFSTLRHARTAFLLSQRPLGAFSEARYGAPDVLVDGARLVQLLRETAGALGIPLEANTPVTDIDAGAATLSFADGRRVPHLAVAVACGIPTDERTPGIGNLLNKRTWSQPEGHVAICGIGTRAERARDHDRFITTWIADGLVAIEEPISASNDDQPLALTLLAPAEACADTDEPAEAFERMLQGTHPHLRNLLENPRVERVSEPVTDIAEFWFAEKLVLLGGACHGHPGFPALNASAALEDAWVLSRMMERWEESPHEGFADYERYRKPRARRLRAFADSERAILTERSAMAAWQRNLKWSLTSRFLPEIAMQRTDWLYGYDCIRGFA